MLRFEVEVLAEAAEEEEGARDAGHGGGTVRTCNFLGSTPAVSGADHNKQVLSFSTLFFVQSDLQFIFPHKHVAHR